MRALLLALLLAGCSLGPAGPFAPPSVDAARALLDEIVDAALDRDFDRLCANASGTCDVELQGVEDRAPTTPPDIVGVTVHEPMGSGDSWTSGGVLFRLCGTDAFGKPYESEVLVFDDGTRLLATAAVFWTGTRVGVAAPGNSVTAGGPPSDEARCG